MFVQANSWTGGISQASIFAAVKPYSASSKGGLEVAEDKDEDEDEDEDVRREVRYGNGRANGYTRVEIRTIHGESETR